MDIVFRIHKVKIIALLQIKITNWYSSWNLFCCAYGLLGLYKEQLVLLFSSLSFA